MGENDTGKEGFVQPNTMADVVGLARQLAVIVADVDWALSKEARADVQNHIHWVVSSIINLPVKPVSEEHTLLYRLARAEAERLFAACTSFEGACKKLRIFGNLDVSPSDSEMAELDVLDYQFLAALKAFIAMAIDM